MLQSIFVYTFLASTMLCSAISYSRNNYSTISIKDVRIIYIIIIYGVICGIRFNVGVDYMAYYNSYISYLRYGVSEAEVSQELGWLWYTKLLASQGLHYSLYFASIAIVQISLIVFTFKRYPKLLPYVIMTFFLSEWFILSQNVLRQITVTFIFLFVAIKYPKLSLYKAIVLSLVTTLIHTTGILMILFLPLVRLDWNKIHTHPFVLIVLYVCLAFIGAKIKVLDSIISNPLFAIILSGSDYQYYMTSNQLEQGLESIVGMGFILNIIVKCILFSQYRCISNIYPNSRFKNWFYCYYLGLCITALFPTSILFTRLFWYLTVFRIPVYAMFFKYCFDNLKKSSIKSLRFQLGTIVLICLLILSTTSMFLKPEGGNMVYKFYWDKRLT